MSNEKFKTLEHLKLSIQSTQILSTPKYTHYIINIFKVVADKDMRKMSNIVENLIRRYVKSRV